MDKKVKLHGKGHMGVSTRSKMRDAARKRPEKQLPPNRRSTRPLQNEPPWKIVFMSPCWFRGGLESVTISHLRNLDRNLFTPSLLVGRLGDGAEDSIPPDVPLEVNPNCFEWNFPPNTYRTNRARLESRHILERIQPDIAVGQLSHGAMFGADEAKVPLLIEYWHSSGGWDRMEHPSNFAIAVSEWTATQIKAVRSVKVPIHTILNGIDNGLFHPPADRFEMRRKWGIQDDELVIGYSGRIAAQKNPISWVNIVAQMNRQQPVKALICGPNHNPTLFARAQEAARQQNLDILWTSASYKEMYLYYGMMDVLLHTSGMETFGMIVVESLLCGTPVVANGVGGVLEIYNAINDPSAFKVTDINNVDNTISTINSILEDPQRNIPSNITEFDSRTMTSKFQDIMLSAIQQM